MPAEDKWLAEKDRAEYVTDAKRKISAVVHRGRCAAPCRALPQRPFAVTPDADMRGAEKRRRSRERWYVPFRVLNRAIDMLLE